MFRRKGAPETGRDALRELVQDLAVAVRDCQARVDSMETRWKDAQDQLRRSYQRLEKAGQRLPPSSVQDAPEEPTGAEARSPEVPARSFVEKWNQLHRRSS